MKVAVPTTLKTWYVYFLCDPSIPDVPFYIGKGTGDRMFHHQQFHSSALCNERKMKIIHELMSEGKEVFCKKVAEFSSELDAYIYEWAMIAVYYDCITNVAHGPSACVHQRAGRVKRVRPVIVHEKVFPIKDVALLLNLHPVTVSEMAREGKINAGRVGRQYRIPQSEIDRLLRGEHINAYAKTGV